MRAKKTRERYSWKAGVRDFRKLDAQSVGEELSRLREAHGGNVAAEDVLDAASEPGSPLHDAFEWSDEEAARQHRLATARSLLRSVRVVIMTPEETEVTVRAFVSVADSKEPGKHTYTSTEYAMGDPALRGEVIKQALREAAAFRRKYAELSELAEIFAAIDSFGKRAA